MTTPAFGLYPTRALMEAQRLGAGRAFALDTPVDDAGVKVFRRSYWLPLPSLLASAQAIRLSASALQLRFAPIRFDVGTARTDWFTDITQRDDDDVQIGFTWPAQVVRVARPAGQPRREIELFRVDGDALAGEPTMTGVTGRDLETPWVGSPLVVRIGEPVFEVFEERDAVLVTNLRGGGARAVPPAAQAQPQAQAGAAQLRQFLASAQVPGLTLIGSPTSPRLKLHAETPSGDMLLWQALQPGEQAGVVLPSAPVVDEWAPALEQLRKLATDPAKPPPTLLRLDIESDAPCTVTPMQLQLAVEVELELLAKPQRLSFDGARPELATLALALPDGVAAEGLRLTGRVVADAAADAAAGAAPADGRRGALLAADQAALHSLDLVQPASIAGLSVFWQPLSDSLHWRARLLADGGGPGARVLAEATATVDTPAGGWLALRWPAIDLQAQRVWAELTVLAGAGLWLFDGEPGDGWIQSPGAAGVRQALPERLALAMIVPPADGGPARAIGVRLGDQLLASELPADALALPVPKTLLPLLASQPLAFTGGVRGSVTVESARLRVLA